MIYTKTTRKPVHVVPPPISVRARVGLALRDLAAHIDGLHSMGVTSAVQRERRGANNPNKRGYEQIPSLLFAVRLVRDKQMERIMFRMLRIMQIAHRRRFWQFERLFSHPRAARDESFSLSLSIHTKRG